MSDFDDNTADIRDWIAHSPSPRAIFESFSGGGISSRSTTGSHPESQTKTVFARMAVRAGLNVPTLNTESISRPDEVLSNNTYAHPPYFTIPSGLSPTTLLESPVFLASSWAQQSPTTGKFQFPPGNLATNSTLNEETLNKNGNQFVNIDSTLFSFRPVLEPGHSSFLGDSGKRTTAHESNIFLSRTEKEHHEMICADIEVSNFLPVDFNRAYIANSHRRVINIVGGSVANSSLLDEEANQMGGGDATRVDACEDGYNWRKYGQKQVKGSDYPRSYYKCTQSSCTVKKKVERSHEGHITEIIYKGAHNHLKPHPNRGSTLGPIDPQLDNNVQTEVAFEGSLAFPYEDDDNDDEYESNLKKRKTDEYVSETSGDIGAIKKPKVVVQTTSQVDVLDDGYHWRKYGQKVVKGNPNPRSYYKCTTPGCVVRKHVERASHDLNSVITMYEGKHNHDVPAARINGYSNLGSSDNRAVQVGKPVFIPAHLHRSEQSQVHNASRYSGTSSMNSLDFGCETGLANLVMARLGHDHNPYVQHQFGSVSEMGFMLPKEEPNLDPLSEQPLISIPDSSSAYSPMRNL